MKFKKGYRVYYEHSEDKDFGKIVAVYTKTGEYLIRPEGASFNIRLKEKFVKKVVPDAPIVLDDDYDETPEYRAKTVWNTKR